MQNPKRTYLYLNQFRRNSDGSVQQKVECIRHYASDEGGVGIHQEWHHCSIPDLEPVKPKFKSCFLSMAASLLLTLQALVAYYQYLEEKEAQQELDDSYDDFFYDGCTY